MDRKVLNLDQFYAHINRNEGPRGSEKAYLDDPMVEVTEEVFEEFLGILPPMGWSKISGVEVFAMCEFMYSNITRQFAKTKVYDETARKVVTRCFSKYIRWRDQSTYINGGLIDSYSEEKNAEA